MKRRKKKEEKRRKRRKKKKKKKKEKVSFCFLLPLFCLARPPERGEGGPDL
jgi:hypothetical protein